MTSCLSRCGRLLLFALCLGSAHAADDFLEPEKAFAISATALDARTVDIAFRIAAGYYMYREAFRFQADGANLGEAVVPAGHVKYDDNLQKEVETHRGELHIRLPVQQAGAEFQLHVTGQGCADKGLCYPPLPSVLAVSLQGFGGEGRVRVVATGDAANGPVAAPAALSEDESSSLAGVLQSGNWWGVIGVFFAAGVLLSLTPCVLPMLPILSSIIAGQQGGASRGRGLLLAASYSLGMALVYTAFGIAAGLVGEGLAAMLQTPLVLGAFAALLVLLSLSMFGVYELQLPAALTGRLSAGSQRLQGGRVAGVFVMGGLSALIVSPCVAAPLAGALVYLSQTRDVVLGGSALFALALGMSVPLLLLGASAGALLPRAGAWMDGVKRFFGLLLLGVAVWLLQPLLPAAVALLAWGGLLLAAAVLLWPRSGGARPGRRIASLLLGALAALELMGAASGGHDPLMPLSAWRQGGLPAPALAFQPVRSVAELDAALASAGRPVMLDFYADWCVSCKEMERFTFSDAAVQARLSKAVLLKADVTASSEADRALLRRFRLFGPPGTIFFDAQGHELRDQRGIGFQGARRFERTLQAAGL